MRVSYLSATIAYGLFAVLLLFSWRESLQGKLLQWLLHRVRYGLRWQRL